MPPAHIFTARHGEQVEQLQRDFRLTAPRPHDSPLTANGVAMAETLGAYLVQHYHVTPTNIVILSSPLTRCVQTSNGIATGALKAAGEAGARDIPVYLEPAIIESARWIHYHFSFNPAIVDPSTGAFNCPDPVYYDAAYHNAHTSPRVQLANPFPLYPTPPHFAVEDGKLVDHSFPDRCDKAAAQLLHVPELDGKTVVLVGHAETAPRVMHALLHTPNVDWHEGLTFTSFVHLTCEGSGADVRVLAESEIFSTPHLSDVRHGDQRHAKETS